MRVARGSLHRLYRGVYAVGHTKLTREGRFLAAVLACGPGAVLSHRSAAILHETARAERSPDRGHRTVPAPHPRDRRPPVRADRAHATSGASRSTPRVRTIIDLKRTADDGDDHARAAPGAVREGRSGAPAEPHHRPRQRADAQPARGRGARLRDRRRSAAAGGGQPAVSAGAPHGLSRPALAGAAADRGDRQRRLARGSARAANDDALRQAELESRGERVLRVTRADLRQRPQQTLARLRAAGVPEA